MESLTGLPPLFDEIVVPSHFSVTQLAFGGDCLLRAAAPASVSPEFQVSPESELGRVLHTLMEMASRGLIHRRHNDRRDLEDALDTLLSEAQDRLAAAPQTESFADLRHAFSTREWEHRRGAALRCAARIAEKTPERTNRTPTAGGSSPLFPVVRRPGFRASEVPIKSDVWRIRGRIDLLETDINRIVQIVDYKSGHVTDENGQVRESIAIQLRMYGLAILELWPDSDIRLQIVSGNMAYPVSFGQKDRDSTIEWIRARTSPLPTGATIKAPPLAKLGAQCSSCRIRPVCPEYRASISLLWCQARLPFPLPLDTAGRVLEVTGSAGCPSTLKIEDLGGRIVKIHRLSLPTGLFPGNSDGFLVWLFNLASSEASFRNSLWRHPLNFHELPTSAAERRAWTCKVFADQR